MKASDLFVEALEAEGVQYVFGVPGEETLDLLDSLSRSSIRFLPTRHEQAAGFMAATHGRLTGKAGVCLATLGPGATNLVTAAAYAQLGAMPMLMITGQKPIKSSKQGYFQIVEVVEMMRPLTKFNQQIVSADRIPAAVREAIRQAEEERPGAVHLELPEDMARERSSRRPLPASYVRRPAGDEKAILRAAQMIEEARRPLLLVGAAANRQLACQRLREFVETLRIPFFSTQMGKGVIDENHPLCLGCAVVSSGDKIHEAIADADLIINVGHDVVEKPPFFMELQGTQVIHVNFTSAIVDPVYFPQVEVVGDIAHSVAQLASRIRPSKHWDFRHIHRVQEEREQATRSATDTHDRFPLRYHQVVAAIQHALPADGIVALDNGLYKLSFARHYRTSFPNTLLIDNALATMGAGLPSAIAAKLIHQHRRVVAVCGDGGFLMTSADLETAVRLQLDLVIVVLRDDAYGMIKWKQRDMGFPTYGLDFGNPDFVRFAESFGATGTRVERAGQFAGILERALESGGVQVIEVPVEHDDA